MASHSQSLSQLSASSSDGQAAPGARIGSQQVCVNVCACNSLCPCTHLHTHATAKGHVIRV